MAFRSSLRPLRLTTARAAAPLLRPAAPRRSFHRTVPASVAVGDVLPDAEVLMEGSPGNKVSLAALTKAAGGDALIIGVPAAFSPACSSSHVPGYVTHPGIKDFGLVAVVSVNDAFVMKAWGDVLDPAHDSGIRFFADPTAQFTKELDLLFDGSAIFGGDRGKRYAIVVKNGKVASVAVEPDNTGTDVSMANKVLG